MKRDTLIEHKEAIIVCEESGPISLNYNVTLSTLKANIVLIHVVLVVTTKSSLTCTNCGKTCHTFETYHNKKIEVPVVLIAIVKSVKPIAKTKMQHLNWLEYLFVILE